VELRHIVSYLDSFLTIAEYRDDSLNGLQVENRGEITKIGLAVDACQEAIRKAEKAGCNLLIVHHGLLWGKQQPLIYHYYERVRSLIMADMALYAAHLPLDGHPDVGHNARIAHNMGLQSVEPFMHYSGSPLGIKGRLHVPQACDRVTHAAQEVIGGCSALITCGPSMISSVAIVSGSATFSELLWEVKRQEIDFYITGEPRHGAYYLARELGLNIFYGGHYRTETFGMRALGEHLEEKLGIPWEFIDAPCAL
jgi:dinuclear metal center YbgI/SA1388 family protein